MDAIPGTQRPAGQYAPRQQPGQGSEHDTVSPVWLLTSDLPALHRDLVPQHEDLPGRPGLILPRPGGPWSYYN
jgi:hypothetical protein